MRIEFRTIPNKEKAVFLTISSKDHSEMIPIRLDLPAYVLNELCSNQYQITKKPDPVWVLEIPEELNGVLPLNAMNLNSETVIRRHEGEQIGQTINVHALGDPARNAYVLKSWLTQKQSESKVLTIEEWIKFENIDAIADQGKVQLIKEWVTGTAKFFQRNGRLERDLELRPLVKAIEDADGCTIEDQGIKLDQIKLALESIKPLE